MTNPPSSLTSTEPVTLSENEAKQLAEELKQQLRQGQRLDGDTQAIERMVAGLGDKRGLLRLTFAESLGAVGSAAVPALCRAMCEHENVTVRRAAAKTLTLISDRSALPFLFRALLNDPDPVVQGSAVGAMAVVGADAVEGLLEILLDPKNTPMQTGLASWGLAFVGARAPEALKQAACSPHARIRTAAIAALGDQIQNLGDQDARRLLTDALNDGDEEVRAEASTLMGKLNESHWALPLLLPKLNDESPLVRKNTALSLMKLEDPSAIQALEMQSETEPDDTVKPILRLAINQLHQHD
ncbi:HEAT repeat domain-containing protein [Synechococcus sp. A10-1-5-9]|uniref:HEAT repeat domain-containing protein n=1 Tax=Synechococcus sp. A10-1-5-9 TaxID=3392295 RepID=UPI0039EB077C